MTVNHKLHAEYINLKGSHGSFMLAHVAVVN